MSDTHVAVPLSPAEARRIDQACDRFEAAWKAGPRPDVAAFLGGAAGPVRSELLRQLLLLDWDYRRRAGDDPRADDYRARFPGDATVIEAVGREAVEAAVSTRPGENGVADRDTPWAGDPVDGPPAEAAADPDRYDLLGEVGHGGIGVVYRGRDRLLGRELAVKVLREAYRDRADARRRFAAEARVGSQLQHPAIVPVYELGSFADGRPYITMKLVEGHTLAALLCDRPDVGRDLPRFLGVFEQVCQAMAYAHSKGVVHRDLKPANVMVGAFGEVQVMDWGFAKILAAAGQPTATEPTSDRLPNGPNGVTHSGALMGTPAYMPPEQARGEAALVGPPADVFALGAILCEILTGQPPYAAATVHEVYRQTTAGDLADAHARLDGCGADAALRDLAKRCLAADRAERPADGGEVAREVTAYLATAQERLRRAEVERAAADSRAAAERRARRLTAAAAAALLVGAGVATWQAVVANRARRDAVAAAAAETAAKQTAQVKEAETRSVLDFVQARVFAAARPEGERGGLGHDVSLRRALKAALAAVDQSFAGQPLVEARVRRTLGDSFLLLGEADVAAEQYRRARAIDTERLGPDDDETLLTTNDLATSYRALGRYPEAQTLLEETLAVRTAKHGPNHPDTLQSMENLATVYADRGRFPDALKLRETVLAIRKAKDGPDHPLTLRAMNNLANSYSEADRPDEALKLDQEAVALLEAKFGPAHPQTLDCRNNLALDYAAAGRYDEALKLQQETLALLRAKLPADHPTILTVMHNVAKAQADLHRYGDAIKVLDEALAVERVKLPPGHSLIAQTVYSLANNYGHLNRHADALRLHREALEMRKAALGPDHRDTLYSMWGVAANLLALDCGAEAVPVIDECLRRATGNAVSPSFSGLADKRLRYFEKAADAAGCRRTAELWEALKCTDAGSLYNAARYRTVTAAVLRPSDAAAAGAEADRAMAWLTKAVAAGYQDAARLAADKDFDALRDRADFRKLLADLEARK